MNELSRAIEQAVQECYDSGNGKVVVNDNLIIATEWVGQGGTDVIEVYIMKNGRIVFEHCLEETRQPEY